MIRKIYFLILTLLTLPLMAETRVLDLRCDGQVDPLAAESSPRLTWRVESPERSAAQSAWQVLVASSAEILDGENGDLWDSGKVIATRLPEVIYAGKAPSAGQRSHWKVRCWDMGGKVSPWSEVAVWETAPLTPDDWLGARWIDDGRALPADDAGFYQPDPAPLVRHEFTLTKPILRARLHIAGLGFSRPTLNGRRVGDHELDPAWTAFGKRILFSTHDVTRQLGEGSNCLGVELGNGWFNPLPLRMWGGRNIREALVTGRPRVIACLMVDHPDGTRTAVVTGPDWVHTPGPMISNSVYLGEVRDARLALPGWNQPDYDVSAWQPVRVVDSRLDTLQPLSMEPIRAGERIPARSVSALPQGGHIVDFGENFTGVPEMALREPAGTRITLRFGELLHPDGTLNPLTAVCGQIKGTRKQQDGTMMSIGGPGAPDIAWQQDVYITSGEDREIYQPHFTWHGFRYMEVSGLTETPRASDFKGIPLRSDFPSVGTFSCSSERLNRIQEMCRRTFLANVVSVQSDCPHRERFGYGGDIVATSEAFLMNFDMAGFYAKTVRDWADGARPDGRLTDTAPFVGIDYCGVGWAMVHPLLLEQIYQHYGNRSLIDEQLPVALRWLESEAAARKEGLVIRGLGDHEALAKAGGPAITTPMFIDAARRISRLCRIAGKEADAVRCGAMATESAAAWANAYLDSRTGSIGEGAQSQQAIALGFGVVPEDSRKPVFDKLVAALDAPDGPRLTTGIFGTRFLLEELSRNDRGDLAFALADRKTFPSWGWMLENDATTLWEHWAGSDSTFTHNHPMFGSISAWFFRWPGGIQVADDAVGADRIVIRPQVLKGLDWVECSHRTIRGMIISNWSRTRDGVRFEITVPPDTTARVQLPVSQGDLVREGGLPLSKAKGVELLAGPVHAMQLGSGNYRFTVTPGL